jgi:phosphoribosylglycinamide formyltransferase-1
VFEPSAYPDRDAYTDAVRDALVARSVDAVVMAGYMRVLGASFFEAFPDRVLNVHPALLPAFPGAHAVADALAWGVKVTGVTVHLVDEEVDHGPIVLQEAVEVRDDDTPESLAPRAHAVEHRLLPAAVRALLEGRMLVEGRTVRIIEGESTT